MLRPPPRSTRVLPLLLFASPGRSHEAILPSAVAGARIGTASGGGSGASAVQQSWRAGSTQPWWRRGSDW
eukprot:COSAG01_NODE_69956_length_260_cov_0.521739_1_plen_69_part_10